MPIRRVPLLPTGCFYREELILESDQAVRLVEHYDGRDFEPVIYFPQSAIAALETSESDLSTHCPIKGDASYRNYGAVENALWFYRTPLPGVSQNQGPLCLRSQ